MKSIVIMNDNPRFSDEDIESLLDDGCTYKEICSKLDISLGTLGTHMKRIHKMGRPYKHRGRGRR